MKTISGGRVGGTVALAAALAIAVGFAVAGPRFMSAPADAADSQKKNSSSAEVATDANGQPGEALWNRTELYFGLDKPDGSEVTKQEFYRFVDKKVTPRFPDGLTLLRGSGQFRESDGDIIEERSRVVILLYPPDDSEANKEIQDIREAYKRAFEQESVPRVDSRERVSF